MREVSLGHYPNDDLRIVRDFLFFPKRIDGRWRWWTVATWTELMTPFGWHPIRWAEDLVLKDGRLYSVDDEDCRPV